MFEKLWTEDMVVSHILNSLDREPLNSHYYSTNYPSVYAAAERIFGGWGEAITAAGLDYNKIRKYRSWSKEKIIKEIKALHESGKIINSNNIQRNYKHLYMAAIHRFFSWGNAVANAGIDYRKIRQRRLLTREEIKGTILDLYKNGEDLAYSNMRNKHSYLLACGSKKLGGGSWAEARRACGISKNFRLKKVANINEEIKSVVAGEIIN